MGRILRLFAVLGVLVLVGAGIFLFIQGQRSAGAQETASEVLEETVVARGSLRVTVGATASVSPARQASLRFEGTGLVTEVLVDEGQAVRAGDPIARLDAGSLEAALYDAQLLMDIRQIALDALIAPPRPEDIAVAQAALDAAQAQLNAAFSTASPETSEIARLQAELARNALYQAQLRRDLAVNPPEVTITQDIPGVGQVSQTFDPPGANFEDFEAGLTQAEFGVSIADARAAAASNRGPDQGAVSSARASVVAAQTTLDRLVNGPTELDLRMAQIELAQAERGVALAQANLDRTTLTAPFDGFIGQINLTVGEPPPTQNAAVVLLDTTGYYLDLPVDETDIARIAVGQPVEVELDALPDAELTGVVSRTAVAPQPQLPGQNVVTYLIRVTIDPTDEPVRANMTATATIVVDSLDDALILPNRFIRIDRQTGRAFVTVASEDGAYDEIPVELGVRNDTQTEIRGGLREGDRAVLLPRAVFDPVAANAGGPPQ